MSSTKMQLDNNKLPKAPIMRQFADFIILAQSEADYESKCNSIRNSKGSARGFYRVDEFPNHPDVEYAKY